MKYIPESVTRTIVRQVLVTKKNSPHIFFVGGLVGIIGSAVLACKATLKLEETIDDIKDDFSSVKELRHSVMETQGSVAYNEREHYKDLTHIYVKSAVKLGKLYGPSVAIGVVSITALTGSHIQMTRRNTALTVTLAAVSKAFDDYRVRVQEEIGKEKELDIHRGLKEASVEGEKKKVKVIDPNAASLYSRVFDEANTNWTKDPELNRLFIQCQQNYFNHRLHANGHVFLNEVYDGLGMERSQAGAVVGWFMDGDGDNFIDFGLFEACSADFMNGLERSIWLDFNVDGVIYNKI